jgi:EAL domain-containing protein (putative c-di-GMP-specific phosphodiesterase class I)
MQALVKKTSSSETSVGARAALSMGLSRIFASLPYGRGWATYPFNTLTLGSHYQPIFRVADASLIGYEALLLAKNITGQQLNPETVFALSSDGEEELFLDWLCRALHLRNVNNIGATRNDRGLIFLNAYPQAAIEDPHHPQVFSGMLAFYGINPRDVVIEILETGASDDAQLADAADLYRRLGCKIAIDDFGIGFSNFDRLWRLRPDFVKIDRSVLKSAAGEQHAKLVLSNMVRMIKSCGAEVIVEGVEERAEAKIAIELGADYLQGFYFAKPGVVPFPQELSRQMISRLNEETQKTQATPATPDYVANLSQLHLQGLTATAAALANGVPFHQATLSFLSLPDAVRAYLIDEQSVPNKVLAIEMSSEQQWLNLPTPDSAIWRLRHTLDRAIRLPNTVQVDTPTNAGSIPPAPTISLSYAFQFKGRYIVLCADVLATDIMSSAIRPAASPAAPDTESVTIVLHPAQTQAHA